MNEMTSQMRVATNKWPANVTTSFSPLASTKDRDRKTYENIIITTQFNFHIVVSLSYCYLNVIPFYISFLESKKIYD